MKSPRVPRLVAALLFAMSLPAAANDEFLPRERPEEVGISSARVERLTEGFERYVDEGKLVGCVVLVARHGKIAYLRAFGQADRERAIPMREDAIFRIASRTKALVSVAVMMLQEEGKLLISDPLGKYLPELRETTVAVPREGGYDVVKAKRPITLRDLVVVYMTQMIPATGLDDHEKLRALVYQALLDGPTW